MTPLELARKISKLPERASIARRYESELTARGFWDPEREKKKYSSQKTHWLGWLKDYGRAGAYNRKNRGVQSAEVVYNRIVCPPMVLWLTEAAGKRMETLRAKEQLVHRVIAKGNPGSFNLSDDILRREMAAQK